MDSKEIKVMYQQVTKDIIEFIFILVIKEMILIIMNNLEFTTKEMIIKH